MDSLKDAPVPPVTPGSPAPNSLPSSPVAVPSLLRDLPSHDQRHHDAVLAEIARLVSRTTGGRAQLLAATRMVDQLARPLMGATGGSLGSSIIAISLYDATGTPRSADDLRKTTRHEVIHFLREHGLIDEEAWRAFQANAGQWRSAYEIDALYAGDTLTDEQLDEEATATAYAEWAAERARDVPGLVRRGFGMMHGFYARVRDAVQRPFITHRAPARATASRSPSKAGGASLQAARAWFARIDAGLRAAPMDANTGADATILRHDATLTVSDASHARDRHDRRTLNLFDNVLTEPLLSTSAGIVTHAPPASGSDTATVASPLHSGDHATITSNAPIVASAPFPTSSSSERHDRIPSADDHSGPRDLDPGSALPENRRGEGAHSGQPASARPDLPAGAHGDQQPELGADTLSNAEGESVAIALSRPAYPLPGAAVADGPAAGAPDRDLQDLPGLDSFPPADHAAIVAALAALPQEARAMLRVTRTPIVFVDERALPDEEGSLLSGTPVQVVDGERLVVTDAMAVSAADLQKALYHVAAPHLPTAVFDVAAAQAARQGEVLAHAIEAAASGQLSPLLRLPAATIDAAARAFASISATYQTSGTPANGDRPADAVYNPADRFRRLCQALAEPDPDLLTAAQTVQPGIEAGTAILALHAHAADRNFYSLGWLPARDALLAAHADSNPAFAARVFAEATAHASQAQEAAGDLALLETARSVFARLRLHAGPATLPIELVDASSAIMEAGHDGLLTLQDHVYGQRVSPEDLDAARRAVRALLSFDNDLLTARREARAVEGQDGAARLDAPDTPLPVESPSTVSEDPDSPSIASDTITALTAIDLRAGLRRDFPQLSVDLQSQLIGNNQRLFRVVAFHLPAAQRNQGFGTRAMARIVDFADANGYVLTTANLLGEQGGVLARGQQFLRRFGFEINLGDTQHPDLIGRDGQRDAFYRMPNPARRRTLPLGLDAETLSPASKDVLSLLSVLGFTGVAVTDMPHGERLHRIAAALHKVDSIPVKDRQGAAPGTPNAAPAGYQLFLARNGQYALRHHTPATDESRSTNRHIRFLGTDLDTAVFQARLHLTTLTRSVPPVLHLVAAEPAPSSQSPQQGTRRLPAAERDQDDGSRAPDLSRAAAAIVAVRFAIPAAAVLDLVETPLDVLRERDRYIPPSNTAATTTDFERLPVGSAKVGVYGDANEAYIDHLAEVDPNILIPSEPEDGIKARDPAFARYVAWFREGHVAPPAQVVESARGDGVLLSTNRRRVLAAQEAGVPTILAWISPRNAETTLPLKYGDVRRAYQEAVQSLTTRQAATSEAPAVPEDAALAAAPPHQPAGGADPLFLAEQSTYEAAIWAAVNARWNAGGIVSYGTSLRTWVIAPKDRGALRFKDGRLQAYDGRRHGQTRWINLGPFGQAIDSLASGVGLPTSFDRTAARSDANPAVAEEPEGLTPTQIAFGIATLLDRADLDGPALFASLDADDVARVLRDEDPAYVDQVEAHLRAVRPDLFAGEVWSAAPATGSEAPLADPTAPVAAVNETMDAAESAGASIPPQVRARVERARSTLLDYRDQLQVYRAAGERFSSPGRYEAEVAEAWAERVASAEAVLAEFRRVAPNNGIDPEAFLADLGGLPDIALSAEAQDWLAHTLARRAAQKAQEMAHEAPRETYDAWIMRALARDVDVGAMFDAFDAHDIPIDAFLYHSSEQAVPAAIAGLAPEVRFADGFAWAATPIPNDVLHRSGLIPADTRAAAAVLRTHYDATNGDARGYVLRQPASDPADTRILAVSITRSAKVAGMWQMTWFDRNGFMSDSQHRSADVAIEEALRAGMAIPVPGLLRELMRTAEFHAGNAATEGVERLNATTTATGAPPVANDTATPTIPSLDFDLLRDASFTDSEIRSAQDGSLSPAMIAQASRGYVFYGDWQPASVEVVANAKRMYERDLLPIAGRRARLAAFAGREGLLTAGEVSQIMGYGDTSGQTVAEVAADIDRQETTALTAIARFDRQHARAVASGLVPPAQPSDPVQTTSPAEPAIHLPTPPQTVAVDTAGLTIDGVRRPGPAEVQAVDDGDEQTVDPEIVALLRLANVQDTDIQLLTPSERVERIAAARAAAENVEVRDLHRPGDQSWYYLSKGEQSVRWTLRYHALNPLRDVDHHVRTFGEDQADAITKARLHLAAISSAGLRPPALHIREPDRRPLSGYDEMADDGHDGRERTATRLRDLSGSDDAVARRAARAAEAADPSKAPFRTSWTSAYDRNARPANPLAAHGLTVTHLTARTRGAPYWFVSGKLDEHRVLLNRLGAGAPWTFKSTLGRSFFDADPTDRILAAIARANDPSAPKPEDPIEAAGLIVEKRISRAEQEFWIVRGDLDANAALLDTLGATAPSTFNGITTRAFFAGGDPSERLRAVLSGAALAEDAKPVLPSIDPGRAKRLLAANRLIVDADPRAGGWVVTGRTYDHRRILNEVGGTFDGALKVYRFTADPTGHLGAALAEFDARGSEAGLAGGDAGRGIDADEAGRLLALRERERERPDGRQLDRPAAELVSDATRALIERGAAFGIPETVIRDQIEDIALVRRAYERDDPLFLVANSAGTGKTFVLGGAIRELRDAGQKRFVYLTRNSDLIDQIKSDLEPFGLDGVAFHTYAELSNKKSAKVDVQDAVLIPDEAHDLKNLAATRGEVGQRLLAGARMTIVSSATLFENPVEARYLAATGIFDEVGGFDVWAKMYGAAQRSLTFINSRTDKEQTETIVYWPNNASKADPKAARDWFMGRGLMTQRSMQIDPSLVAVRFTRLMVDPEYVALYEQVNAAYDTAVDQHTDEDGQPIHAGRVADIVRHRENTLKRILEAAKLPGAIDQARQELAAGKRVALFTETKSERELGRWRMLGAKHSDPTYSAADVVAMMAEWRQEAAFVRIYGDGDVPRPPFAAFIEDLAVAFDVHGIQFDLPSPADEIVAAFGKDRVAVYTGAVTDKQASQAKEAFRSGAKPLMVLTMAKGGTGLSLHDTVGTMPTAQINLTLPWTATQVEQVSARCARYGLRSKAVIDWLFAANIPWEAEKLAPKVGRRMAEMGALVRGVDVRAAEALTTDFDFTGTLSVTDLDPPAALHQDPSEPVLPSASSWVPEVPPRLPPVMPAAGEHARHEGWVWTQIMDGAWQAWREDEAFLDKQATLEEALVPHAHRVLPQETADGLLFVTGAIVLRGRTETGEIAYFPADGLTVPIKDRSGTIRHTPFVSMTAANPLNILYHESIHVNLREGRIDGREYQHITELAEPGLHAGAAARYGLDRYGPGRRSEELACHLAGEWAAGDDARAFDLDRDLWSGDADALRAGLRSTLGLTPEVVEVLARLTDGTIGRRPTSVAVQAAWLREIGLRDPFTANLFSIENSPDIDHIAARRRVRDTQTFDLFGDWAARPAAQSPPSEASPNETQQPASPVPPTSAPSTTETAEAPRSDARLESDAVPSPERSDHPTAEPVVAEPAASPYLTLARYVIRTGQAHPSHIARGTGLDAAVIDELMPRLTADGIVRRSPYGLTEANPSYIPPAELAPADGMPTGAQLAELELTTSAITPTVYRYAAAESDRVPVFRNGTGAELAFNPADLARLADGATLEFRHPRANSVITLRADWSRREARLREEAANAVLIAHDSPAYADAFNRFAAAFFAHKPDMPYHLDLTARTSKTLDLILNAAIRGVYNDALHPNNVVSRGFFAEITGTTLPAKVSDTQSAFTGEPFPLNLASSFEAVTPLPAALAAAAAAPKPPAVEVAKEPVVLPPAFTTPLPVLDAASQAAIAAAADERRAAVIAAVEGALDAGLTYTREVETYVVERIRAVDEARDLYLGAVIRTPAQAGGAAERAVAERLAASPRGTWAVIVTELSDGPVVYAPKMSDGSGTAPSSYDTYEEMPDYATVYARMVGHEVYKARQTVEAGRDLARQQAAASTLASQVGTRLKDVTLDRVTYASATVTGVDQAAGLVSLALTRRGTSDRWNATVPATTIARLLAARQQAAAPLNDGLFAAAGGALPVGTADAAVRAETPPAPPVQTPPPARFSDAAYANARRDVTAMRWLAGRVESAVLATGARGRAALAVNNATPKDLFDRQIISTYGVDPADARSASNRAFEIEDQHIDAADRDRWLSAPLPELAHYPLFAETLRSALAEVGYTLSDDLTVALTVAERDASPAVTHPAGDDTAEPILRYGIRPPVDGAIVDGLLSSLPPKALAEIEWSTTAEDPDSVAALVLHLRGVDPATFVAIARHVDPEIKADVFGIDQPLPPLTRKWVPVEAAASPTGVPFTVTAEQRSDVWHLLNWLGNRVERLVITPVGDEHLGLPEVEVQITVQGATLQEMRGILETIDGGHQMLATLSLDDAAPDWADDPLPSDIAADWRSSDAVSPAPSAPDFVNSFPAPLETEDRQSPYVGQPADFAEQAALHGAIQASLHAEMAALDRLDEASVAGIDPRTGRRPRTAEEIADTAEVIASGRTAVTTAITDTLAEYAAQFGDEAGHRFEAHVRTSYAGLRAAATAQRDRNDLPLFGVAQQETQVPAQTAGSAANADRLEGRSGADAAPTITALDDAVDAAMDAAADAVIADRVIDQPTQPTPAVAESGSALTAFAIRNQADLAPSGQRAKISANLAALRLLNDLTTTGRPATPADQQVLARYSGWGHSPQVFDEAKLGDWAAYRADLQALLTPEAFAAARLTTLNAHYTSQEVISAVWQAAQDLGFAGGRVLEPGCGIGNFVGAMPASLSATTSVVGVELDPTTAAIAGHLYPNAEIRAEGFEVTNLPPDSFDLAIGNVPFGKIVLHDPKHNRNGHSIHNHFIVKSLAFAKPGAVLAVVTSRYTLDARNPSARREMAEHADLLGAVRLPETAFRANAGTDAVTDILFLRKRHAHEQPFDQSWISTTRLDLSDAAAEPDAPEAEPVHINRYFADNPSHVLGTFAVEHGMHNAMILTVKPVDAGPLASQIAAAVGEIVDTARANDRLWNAGGTAVITAGDQPVASPTTAPAAIKDGAFYLDADGTIRISRHGYGEPAPVPDREKGEVALLIRLRDAVHEVLDIQSRDTTPVLLPSPSAGEGEDMATGDGAAETAGETEVPAWHAAQQRLNSLYDQYKATYGLINRYFVVNRGQDDDGEDVVARRYPRFGGFRRDPDFASVMALELFDDETQDAEKAAIFSKRVLNAPRVIRGADDAHGALLAVLEEVGRVDLPRMASLLGTSEDSVIAELKGAIYKDPALDAAGKPAWVTADAYLSGNVRQKLQTAEAAAMEEPAYSENVLALQKVQPRDLAPREIKARLGSSWIPASDVQEFAAEILNSPATRVGYAAATNSWTVWAPRDVQRSVAARTEWGTRRRDALTLLEDALSGRPTEVFDKDPDGTRRKNAKATLAACEKREKIEEHFGRWIWQDAERAARLAAEYNTLFNATVLRSFDGSHLSLPGLSTALTPREHQRNVVWRICQDGNTLMAHTVGAGKTLASIMASQEERRLGLTRKPAFAVPNHMLEQFAREFKQAYPAARLLIADKEAVSTRYRKEFVARCAVGDWDAVIFTHSTFAKIPVSPESAAGFIQEQVDDLEQAIRAAADDEGGRLTVKRLEAVKKNYEERLKGLLDAEDKDDGISFEMTGIDRIYVDELHLFKNLPFQTSRSGVSAPASKRAEDLYLKKEILEGRTPGRSLVGMTGTPIANRVAEMYVMQKFFDKRGLQARGIAHFDAWAANFGQDVTSIELSPDGASFRMNTRFAKYVNVPELLVHFRQFTDVQTADMLNLPVPDLLDGKPKVIAIPATPLQKAYIDSIKERIERIRSGDVEPTEDNMLKVTSDGRKAAADMQLLGFPAEMSGDKSATVGENIARIYHETKDRQFPIWGGTRMSPHVGALQLVFCDLGTPKADGSFSMYDAITETAIANGVPADRIRYIHDYGTDEAKARLFKDCRAGRVSVLFGSTEKMGVGTNVQDRLAALHNVDCPWRPVDIEQRNGRMIRQGNLHKDLGVPVEIIIYGTEGTFDVYMWQTAQRKQEFIAQVMKGNLEQREIEEIDGQALSYAEAKAILTGNPILMQKAGVDAEVAKLDRAYRNHEDDQMTLRRTVSWSRTTIEEKSALIPIYEAAQAAVRLPPDDAPVTEQVPLVMAGFDAAAVPVPNRRVTDDEWRANPALSTVPAPERLRDAIVDAAGKALIGAIRREWTNAQTSGRGFHAEEIGSYAGLPLVLESGGRHGDFVVVKLAVPTLQNRLHCTSVNVKDLGKKANGFNELRSIAATVRGLPWEIESARKQIRDAEDDIAQAEAALGTPFDQAARLEALLVRQAEINAQLADTMPVTGLDADGNAAVAGSDEDGQAGDAQAALEPAYDERDDLDNIEKRSYQAGFGKAANYIRRTPAGELTFFDASSFARELGRASDQPNRARALGLAHAVAELGIEQLKTVAEEVSRTGYGSRDNYRGKSESREFLIAAAAVHGWGRVMEPQEATTQAGWPKWQQALAAEIATQRLAGLLASAPSAASGLQDGDDGLNDRDLYAIIREDGFAAEMAAAANRLPPSLRHDRDPAEIHAAILIYANKVMAKLAADYQSAIARKDSIHGFSVFFKLPSAQQRSLYDALPSDAMRDDYAQKHAAYDAKMAQSRRDYSYGAAGYPPPAPIAPAGEGIIDTLQASLQPKQVASGGGETGPQDADVIMPDTPVAPALPARVGPPNTFAQDLRQSLLANKTAVDSILTAQAAGSDPTYLLIKTARDVAHALAQTTAADETQYAADLQLFLADLGHPRTAKENVEMLLQAISSADTPAESHAPAADLLVMPASSSVDLDGRRFETLTFTTDDAANGYMAAHPGYGVLSVAEDGTIHLAHVEDKGQPIPPAPSSPAAALEPPRDMSLQAREDRAFALHQRAERPESLRNPLPIYGKACVQIEDNEAARRVAKLTGDEEGAIRSGQAVHVLSEIRSAAARQVLLVPAARSAALRLGLLPAIQQAADNPPPPLPQNQPAAPTHDDHGADHDMADA